MLFNSIEFFLFLLFFFACWPLARQTSQHRWIYLTLTSLFFYGWSDWRYLFLVLASGLLDYWAGLLIPRFPRYRHHLLLISMSGNLGLLFFFKYLDFFFENLNFIFSLLGLSLTLSPRNLTLPVGISFYTFQSMSYTIDIYRGQLQPARNVWHFFSFLLMFPQLVAGPIVRASDLLPQLEVYRSPSPMQQWNGFRLILYGYFKKVVIADNVAVVVDEAFQSVHPMGQAYYWWFILILFALQIYCDFSGYTDIARGLGKWMGYDFAPNFQHPYLSCSIREFWQRWHISLSTWFRDYVYIPLGGSRHGVLNATLVMWLTLLISGFWHGAAWTFLMWGGLHAAYLTIERLTAWPQKIARIPGGRWISLSIVFVFVLLSWVFFRANNVSQALQILNLLFSFDRGSLYDLAVKYPLEVVLSLLMAGRHFFIFVGGDQLRFWRSRRWQILEPFYFSLLITICIYFRGPGKAFIYFQF